MEAAIRKNQSLLICSGTGVIIFGIWSLFKVLLIIVMQPDYFKDSYDEIPPEYLGLFKVAAFGVVLLVLLADLLFKIYIGKAAIYEGKGNRKGNLYLVFAIISVLFVLTLDVLSIVFPQNDDIVNAVITSFIDISSCVAPVIIVVAAVRLRRLQKKSGS